MCLLQDKEWWGPTIYYSKQKQKKTKNKNKDAPRTAHIIWSNKNIAYWERTWYFVDEEGDARASPSFDACTSWISLGVKWASPSLSFCTFFILLHHSSLPTLENSLHTKLNTILISSISTIKIIDQLWFSFDMYRASNIT